MQAEGTAKDPGGEDAASHQHWREPGPENRPSGTPTREMGVTEPGPEAAAGATQRTTRQRWPQLASRSLTACGEREQDTPTCRVTGTQRSFSLKSPSLRWPHTRFPPEKGDGPPPGAATLASLASSPSRPPRWWGCAGRGLGSAPSPPTAVTAGASRGPPTPLPRLPSLSTPCRGPVSSVAMPCVFSVLEPGDEDLVTLQDCSSRGTGDPSPGVCPSHANPPSRATSTSHITHEAPPAALAIPGPGAQKLERPRAQAPETAQTSRSSAWCPPCHPPTVKAPGPAPPRPD